MEKDSEGTKGLLQSASIITNIKVNEDAYMLDRETDHQQRTRIDRFLSSIQGSGYRMAQLATSNRDDALELVQETMLQLVKRYADRPNNELKILFYKILNSRITDWYRKMAFRKPFQKIFQKQEYIDGDPIENLCKDIQRSEEEHFETTEHLQKLVQSLASLSKRQKQVFLLRAWQGFSVKETAEIVGCSQGSIKTHYSRAISGLKTMMLENKEGNILW